MVRGLKVLIIATRVTRETRDSVDRLIDKEVYRSISDFLDTAIREELRRTSNG